MKRRIYLLSALVVTITTLVVLGGQVSHPEAYQDRVQTMPESWAGIWEVTVSYSNRETGAVIATDITTEEICPGEPIIPPSMTMLVRCSDAIGESELSLTCLNRQRMIRNRGCNVDGNLDFTSQLSGESWTGNGSWSVTFAGECTQSNYTEDFVVSGRRIGAQTECGGEPSSLVEKFFLHSRIVPLLETGSN